MEMMMKDSIFFMGRNSSEDWRDFSVTGAKRSKPEFRSPDRGSGGCADHIPARAALERAGSPVQFAFFSFHIPASAAHFYAHELVPPRNHHG
jgi:hypothetical protein